ncbi:MAG: hypothetical protein WAW31_13345 [Smithella sp.]
MKMSNWNSTVLECSNSEVVKACATAIRDSDRNDMNGWKDGDTTLCAKTANGIPHDKVIEISKQVPNDIIICRYSFEHDMFSQIHTLEYSNGAYKEVNLEPGYMSGHIPLNNDNDRDAIIEKATAFCRKLDTTETDKDGNLFINWFDEKVCYTFEYDGADGKKYRVEATKEMRHGINFKVYEGHVKYDWKEVSDRTIDDDIPF